MYATCLHCNAKLGANEVIEHFPVGRRLAFDGAKGRLWVVCPKCHRWNLTPLEERWEAIEECERQFRDTRLRASTDNIGLAKVREGLELVRIGKPQRPEMAAWRYAREFGRRWKTRGLPILGGFGGLVALNGFTIISTGPTLVATAGLIGAGALFIRGEQRVRFLAPDGRAARLKPKQVRYAALLSDGSSGWAIRYGSGESAAPLRGAVGDRVMRALLTSLNFQGGPAERVGAAEQLLESAGTAETYIRRLARASKGAGATEIVHHPWDVRLALEMAFQDDAERRAMEGELKQLEREWALAEEVAGIADGLLVPADIVNGLARMTGAVAR